MKSNLISDRDNLSTDVGTIMRSMGGGGHPNAGADLLTKIEILVFPLSEL
jgi:nanoRNase/pAp phosphatase (c-di-AMP/oligoRNAs hydrolase)